jgi:two-component system, OmpR family, copper resistance phosphate regulon response regulator CusR
MKLLIVEDEARIASFLVKGLRAEGYAVEHVTTGAEAIARTAVAEYDLVVLDLMLPDVDGLEVLRALRRGGQTMPVIILTARGEVEELVEGLELGADDYLTKPFSFDELLARVRARLRGIGDRGAAVLRTGGLALDLRTRQADIEGRIVDLAAREFALLEMFMRHAGQVLTREQLLAQVWGREFDVTPNVVDVYVGYLRRKLGAHRIVTVRGAGYRLEID